MLLRSEDGGTFQASLEKGGREVRAAYSVGGKVQEAALSQSDSRVFASEEEARTWLDGEAQKRGFKDYPLEIKSSA